MTNISHTTQFYYNTGNTQKMKKHWRRFIAVIETSPQQVVKLDRPMERQNSKKGLRNVRGGIKLQINNLIVEFFQR